MILRNRARCNHCLQVVESKHRHNFRSCRCGAISVDGGKDYVKRSAKDLSDLVELSVNEADLYLLAGRLYEHRVGGRNLSRVDATKIMLDYLEWFMRNLDTLEPEVFAGLDIEYLSRLLDEELE